VTIYHKLRNINSDWHLKPVDIQTVHRYICLFSPVLEMLLFLKFFLC
jgi:hypothetical protein